MAWTAPKTWGVGEYVTAAMLNTQIRDNLTYLYDRPYYQSIVNVAGTTTTSATWNDVHSSLKLNITHPIATGFQLVYLVGFSGMFKASSSANSYRIGLSFNGSNSNDHVYNATTPVANASFPIAMTVMRALGQGSHTIEVNWLIGGGLTLEAVGNWRLWALEIGQTSP
jgi:hypothetical protein